MRIGAPVTLRLDSLTASLAGKVGSLAATSSEIEKGLLPTENYKGIQALRFYVARVTLPNKGEWLRDGMTGTAKILVRRRSLAGLAWLDGVEFVRRKVW
jgi:putative peptide zinc metalloprotease protein